MLFCSNYVSQLAYFVQYGRAKEETRKEKIYELGSDTYFPSGNKFLSFLFSLRGEKKRNYSVALMLKEESML